MLVTVPLFSGQAEAGKIRAEDLVRDLSATTERLSGPLGERLANHGLKLELLTISSAVVADEVREAVEKKVAAETTKEALLLEAEGKAQAALEEARGQQQIDAMTAEAKRLAVEQAQQVLIEEESDKLLDQEMVVTEAIAAVEQNGIVFLDEVIPRARATFFTTYLYLMTWSAISTSSEKRMSISA